MELLTISNTKLAKGEKKGYLTFGIHLAPADLSGRNVCPMASTGCKTACLNTAGRGRFDMVQKARLRKTNYFFDEREKFLAQLRSEIHKAIKKASRKDLIPCFRLNLTSDIRWENFDLMQNFPDVQFYDYTKDFKRFERPLPANYHLTFSRSETNGAICETLAAQGKNVAVVFAGGLPSHYFGNPVIDGDETDLRFLDPRPCIVGLKTKGLAKQDNSGFVVKV